MKLYLEQNEDFLTTPETNFSEALLLKSTPLLTEFGESNRFTPLAIDVGGNGNADFDLVVRPELMKKGLLPSTPPLVATQSLAKISDRNLANPQMPMSSEANISQERTNLNSGNQEGMTSTVLTFDDISNADSGLIPDGYGGLTWSGGIGDFSYINGGDVWPGTGYDNGTVSGEYVAFNGFAEPVTMSSETDFDFNSAYLTAAWNEGLNIEVVGFSDGLELYSQTVVVDPYFPTEFEFNFFGVDEVEFTSFGGTDADLGGSGEHFALDNLTIEAEAGEPGSISGYKWHDVDGNSVWDEGEPWLADWTIFIDDNNNGLLDSGEIATTTTDNGFYSFENLDPGIYTIAEVLQPGWVQTYPVAAGEYDWVETEYNWIDISDVGTEITLSDDDYEQVSLPFDFPFYGEDQSTVKISSNGYLTFGADGTDFTNDPIPDSNNPNDLIAPFWDDLNPSLGGSIYYHYDAVEEQFIVQYEGVPHYSFGGSFTFEAILEPDGSILYQYNSLSGSNSATIGIENADGSEGVEVSYNDGYPSNSLAVSIFEIGGELQPHLVSVDNGEEVTDINFGNRFNEPGLISGYAWEDLNEDGIWGGGEPAFEGITIYLDLDESGDLTPGDVETLTNSNGYYEFNVDPGIYDVRGVTPDTHVPTFPEDDFYDEVVLPGGETVEGLDFGYALGQPGSISGYKWHDLNGNSLWDDGEPELPDWTIYIDANENGMLDEGELSTVTDEDGFYRFEDLIAGTYVIGEVLQPGWIQTYPDLVMPEGESENGTYPSPDLGMPKTESEHYPDREIPIAPEYARGEVIVKFSDRAQLSTLESLKADLGATTVKATQKLGIELWSIQGDVAEAIATYSNDPRLEYIEPNYTITLDATVPNDPNFEELWGLNNTGQTGGTPDADIDAPEAWDIQTGNNVLVGVIDTGIDYNHPDLVNNMWVNPGEIAGNGLDDDGNGYVDDVHGYDFAYNDSDPFDGDGHGTHVAGTIAADGNNGQGVVGVNWEADLMALKFLNDSGSGSTMDAILAVEYATMMGAQVTNNSWGGGGFSQGLYDAIAAAGAADSLFMAAAGNNGGNNDAFPHYPSNYDLDNIISVASTTHTDSRSSFSNYGATSVDLGAPGSDIYSTWPGGGYNSIDGTSMATPHVAGVASLILAENPNLSALEVKEIILDSVDPIPALDGITVTGGRLNAFNALSSMGVLGTHTVELAWNQDVTDINFGNREIVPGSISGYKWHDLNGDGIWDESEPRLPDWTIFIDDNNNGVLDEGETSTVTDAEGFYSFENLDPDTYTIAEVLEPGWEQTFPSIASQELFRADFSNDSGAPSLDGFTIDNTGGAVDGLWHLSTGRGNQPNHSADDSMYFGQGEGPDGGGNYDVGWTAGRITSPMIDLTGVSDAELSFNYFLEAEVSPWDDAVVFISEDGGSFTPIASKNQGDLINGTSGWTSVSFDLSAYAGSNIQVQFDFDTFDSVANNFEGWYMDDVVVATPSGDPFHTVSIDFGENVTNINFGNQLDDNQPPAIEQLFFKSVDENSFQGTFAGLVRATDPDDDSLTFTISAGNPDNDGDGTPAFAINSFGNLAFITVGDGDEMDFEQTPEFELDITVSDGSLTDTATGTVTLNDLNEAPILPNTSFAIPADSPNGTVIGSVSASDPDGDLLTLTIISGNFDQNGNGIRPFAIDDDGILTVADTEELVPDTTAQLLVIASDGALFDFGMINVDLLLEEETVNQYSEMVDLLAMDGLGSLEGLPLNLFEEHLDEFLATDDEASLGIV